MKILRSKKMNSISGVVWVILFLVLSITLMMSMNTRAATVPAVKYQAHIQDSGWLSAVSNGKTGGSTGRAKRLEALKITLSSHKKSMITYRVHVSNIGWQGWKTSGQMAGTTGRSYAIEAIQIKLTGKYAKKYDIYYRVHVPYKGWLGWAKNGSMAGSTGMGLRTEAIQIKLVKKGKGFNINGKASLTKPSLSYKAHSQDYGWKKAVGDGAVAGTTGESKRLEALVINYKNFNGGNGVTYRAHVSNVGWQNWVTSGKVAGTTGRSLAIEAVQIQLSGGMENYFDIYYRMHVANRGWLGWAKNGEIAGTTGGGIRGEAIQIRIVSKGASFAYHDESASATENAWYPMSVMGIYQIAYESYSHGSLNAMDISGSPYMFAPFTGRIVSFNRSYGKVIFVSENKVRYADGTTDYMSLLLLHASNLDELERLYKTNALIKQGTDFYHQGRTGAGGVANPAYGIHVEVRVARGKRYSDFSGDVFGFDAFYINRKRTTTFMKMGVMESGNYMTRAGAPSNWTNRWRYLN